MGRHSAPDDDEDDRQVVVGAVDVDDPADVGTGSALGTSFDGSAASDIDPQDGSLRPGRRRRSLDLPSAQTRSIPVVDAEIAADADAHLAPMVGIPAREFAPILPGEALVPPHASVQPVDEPVDDFDALDALLRPPTKPRPAPRRTKAEKNAPAVGAAPVADPVVDPAGVATSLETEPETAADLPADAAADLPAEAAADLPSDAPAASSKPAAAESPHATAADLALLRANRSLLARVLAGLLVPFVVYVAVMLIIGAHGTRWVIWIWIPMILAGVLAGSFLDVAHKSAASEPRPEAAEV